MASGSSNSSPRPLDGKSLIVAVCGGIAAYKAADLVSKLVQNGAGVDVVMTEPATHFVGPLTFQALSGRPVRINPLELPESNVQHIALTEHAALCLVAPATADIIAKAANGLCDDLVSLIISAAACPVVFCPAMNWRMWAHPAAKENVARLTKMGYRFIGPDDGWQACRHKGLGRMSEPAAILEAAIEMLTKPGQLPKAIVP